MFNPTQNSQNYLSTWDLRKYEALAQDYNDMLNAHEYVCGMRRTRRTARWNEKVNQAEAQADKIDFKRWHQVMNDDYFCYKVEVNNQNRPLAIGGIAGVLQDELLTLLKAADKLKTLKGKHTGSKSQKEFSQRQTDAVILHFDERGYISATRLMLADGDYTTPVSVPFRIRAKVTRGFAVAIDFKALYEIVKLADKGGRIDFEYRHLIGRLVMREGWEGRQRTSFVVNDVVQSMIGK